jgi:hypothetical protein
MKIVVYETEWYPVNVFDEDLVGWEPDDATEVADTVVARWKKTFDEFKALQTELSGIKWRKRDEPSQTPSE